MRLRKCNYSRTLVRVYRMSQKPLQIPFLICVKIDSKTYFTPFFVSFISRLNPKRVRYPLQMLEPFSTVFPRDKRFENYCISCFEQLKTPKNKRNKQPRRNYRTIRANNEHFCCELLSNSTDKFVTYHWIVEYSP